MANDPLPLDDSQLLALSTMAYRLDRAGEIAPGDTVGAIAAAMRETIITRMVDTGHAANDNLSQAMSYADWLCVVESAAASRALSGLVVDAIDIDDAGAKKILLTDGVGRAYAVFGGTGAGEWVDNVEAAYEVDSVQQRRALMWLEAECENRAYTQVTACGHSKGGNKAMYIAVRSSAVDRVVAFDAQGFSRAFVRAYGQEILANTQKITQYSLDNDYVNGLLACIALHSRRIYVDGSHIINPVAYHSPFSLFNPYHGSSGHILEIGGQVTQARLGKAFGEFSTYVQDNADDYEFRQICACFGEAFENLLAPHVPDDERTARSIAIMQTEGFRLLLDYLGRFFASSVQSVGIADVLGVLLPVGKRGRTLLDDVKLGALDAVSSALKYLTR